MKLVPGLFGEQFTGVKNPPFKIHTGQWRTPSVSHNGGWYNSKGEKIGFGDLAQKDLDRIAKDIDENELFIVLGERDSFWTFVTHHGVIGSMCGTNDKEKNPGMEYVAEHAPIVISKGLIQFVDNLGTKKDISNADLLQLMKDKQ